MNQDQLTSIIRAVLNVVGGSAVAKGYMDNSQWEAIAGGVITVVAVVWAWKFHADPKP